MSSILDAVRFKGGQDALTKLGMDLNVLRRARPNAAWSAGPEAASSQAASFMSGMKDKLINTAKAHPLLAGGAVAGGALGLLNGLSGEKEAVFPQYTPSREAPMMTQDYLPPGHPTLY